MDHHEIGELEGSSEAFLSHLGDKNNEENRFAQASKNASHT